MSALITLDRLACDGPAGPVFRLRDLTVPRTGLTILYGPAGSGRSSALLALCGRLGGLRGRASFDGLDLVRDARRVRARTAVARIAGLVDLEGRLTVAESVTERALTEGVRPAAAEQTVRRVEDLLGRPVDRADLVEHLSAPDRLLLTVALGLVGSPELMVVDDVAAGLGDDDRRSALAALQTVAESQQVALLAAALTPHGAPPGAHLMPIAGPPGAGPGPVEVN